MKKLICYLLILFSISCGNKQVKNENNIKNNVDYYENGKIKSDYELKDGVKHGKFKLYSSDGKLLEQGDMYEGKRNGLCKQFDSNGKLVKVCVFAEDSLIRYLDLDDYIYKKKRISGIQIFVPKKWEEVQVNSPNFILGFKKNYTNHDLVFTPNISITKEKFKDGEKFKDFFKRYFTLLFTTTPKFKALSEKNLFINDFQAYQMIFRSEHEGLPLCTFITCIKVEDSAYIIIGGSLCEKEIDFLEYKGLFKEISESFDVVSS